MLWSTVDPTHLAGRLDINIHSWAVLTAVLYRLGDGVAVGGRFVRSGGPRRCCRRVVRRKSVMLWSAVDPTHLVGRLDINIHPFAVLTAVSYRLGDDVAVGGRFVRPGGPRRCCRRVARRESVMMWSTVNPTHWLGGWTSIFTLWPCSRPFRTVLATPLLWVGDLFGQVVPGAAVGVS